MKVILITSFAAAKSQRVLARAKAIQGGAFMVKGWLDAPPGRLCRHAAAVRFGGLER
ncbi:MAG TPA: hypothetical protein VGJ79_06360 [Candidatus Dormibacteraeota bacterium]|jgi:hypothetical protein